MNRNIILLIVLISITFSCKREDKNSCYIHDPMEELEWLNKSRGYYDIYACNYDNGKTGFIVCVPCWGCIDASYTLQACDGTIICSINEFLGENNCVDMKISHEQIISSRNTYGCYEENPLKELSWLKKHTKGLDDKYIYQYSYDGDNVGFLIADHIGTRQESHCFYSCDGKLLYKKPNSVSIDFWERAININLDKLIWQNF